MHKQSWLLLLSAYILTGCTTAIPQSSTILEPATLDLQAPPTVISVDQESEIAKIIEPGNQLIAVDETPTPNNATLLQLVADPSIFQRMGHVKTTSGEVVKLPMEAIFPGTDNATSVNWIQPGSTAIYSPYTNPDGVEQTYGMITAGKLVAAIATRHWHSNPQILEVQLTAAAPTDCNSCGLKDIRVIELPHNSWVQPISINQAAWAVYPDIGSPEQKINVPPPTPVGGTAISNSYGTFSGQNYGNQTYGTYSGNTVTTYYPTYDYTATNAANIHNLAVAIRNERIENQNNARSKFITARVGNLRLGELNPGETIVGHIFYALPTDFSGPFGVEIVNTSGDAMWLRFDHNVNY